MCYLPVHFIFIYRSRDQQKIIRLISEDHQLSAVKLAEKIGVASRNIENNIKRLKEYGILIRHGSPRNGYWEIIDKDIQE